jgi:hypothetical protein
MGEIFSELGVKVTKENKKEIDRKIQEYIGIDYNNCSATWKLIKARRAADPESFMNGLKTALI